MLTFRIQTRCNPKSNSFQNIIRLFVHIKQTLLKSKHKIWCSTECENEFEILKEIATFNHYNYANNCGLSNWELKVNRRELIVLKTYLHMLLSFFFVQVDHNWSCYKLTINVTLIYYFNAYKLIIWIFKRQNLALASVWL